ncbi:MAG: ABC transporter ATP-binding protein [Verrucomicrobiota bacterium]
MNIIETRGLRKRYRIGNEVVNALDGVDVSIREGELVAITGSSGSGKSTLMHVLGFMDRPTEGDLFFEGENVTHLSKKNRAVLRSRKIGFVFQSFNLLPRLSVFENILLPTHYARRRDTERRERAIQVLERVGMEHRKQHTPLELSGGERQRVAIARSLINTPRLILGDEPTGNLDSKNVDKIMDLFGELKREGNTLAIVTHDPHVAGYCDRVIRMKDGVVVENYEQEPKTGNRAEVSELTLKK